MMFLTLAAFALTSASSAPPLRGSDLLQAIGDYKAMLAGQEQLADLPLRRRRVLIELDRWLRAQSAVEAPETKQECEARLRSRSPSALEQALLDLKCSQRPSS